MEGRFQLRAGGLAYLLEDKVGVPATNSLDGGDGEHDVPLAVNVGVHDTQNVLKRGGDNQRHLGGPVTIMCG